MRPGGIQDESSKHEHQEGAKLLRFLSHTKDAVCSLVWQFKHHTPRKLSHSYLAVKQGRIRGTQRRRLNNVSRIIYSHTAWMGRVLLAAEKSQLIDPAFVKKVAAVKDDLEVAAAAPTMQNASNYEHFALWKRQMIQLVDARRKCAYLCKVLVLDVERAEL